MDTLEVSVTQERAAINAIAPGFMETEMTRATAARVGISPEDVQAAAAKV